MIFKRMEPESLVVTTESTMAKREMAIKKGPMLLY